MIRPVDRIQLSTLSNDRQTASSKWPDKESF